MKETVPHNLKIVSGIYMIWNSVSQKYYIGSSINVHYRWKKHQRLLLLGTHTNIKLQNTYNKYGIQTFEFFVLELVPDKTQLLIREQYWIDFIPPIFNIVRDVRKSSLGTKTKKEVLERLSIIRKGKKHTEEFKVKARERMIGNKYASGKTHEVTDETRRKISEKLTGRKRPEDFCKKMSEKLKGRTLPQETREKIMLTWKGKKNIDHTPIPSTRTAIGENQHCSKLGVSQVLEIRDRFANGTSGLVLSKEYGIANGHIYRIVNRKSWKHI